MALPHVIKFIPNKKNVNIERDGRHSLKKIKLHTIAQNWYTGQKNYTADYRHFNLK